MTGPVSAAAATNAPQAKTGGEDLVQAKRAAGEIEAVFIQQLLQSMRQASRPASGQQQSQSRRIYEDMMDEHLGRILAKGGGIGLGDLVVRDLARRQATPKNPSSAAPTRPMGERAGAAAQGDRQ